MSKVPQPAPVTGKWSADIWSEREGKWAKGKSRVGKYTQDKQENGSSSKEDTEHLKFKAEMAKLQIAEKALSELDDHEDSLAHIRANIKEARKNANGGVEQTRAEKAQ
eukprot:15973057-Heterocapsa_arctica.AAC.1